MINALRNKYYEFLSYPDKADHFILDEMNFRAILKYERKRSDRENKCFSLVVFKCNGDVQNLIGEINRKIRKIDHLGLLSENCLALILPLVSKNEASLIVDAAFGRDFLKIIGAKVDIYTYPDHWHFDDLIDDKSDTTKKLEKDDLKDEITEAFVVKIPFWKRIFDIMISLLLIIFLLPLFILTYIYIKIISPGPVLFKQKRIGYKRKPFEFYKFRTMHVNNDQKVHESYLSQLINNDKPMAKLDHKNDCRIIKGGGIMRKACIDELPQLFNVLKGDMSLIGPRPCLPYEEKEFLHWFRNRFDILPGMTGLWQVSGKNKLSFKQMIRLDIKYIRNLSLLQDIKIFILTIPTVISLAFESKIQKMKNLFGTNKKIGEY